MGGGGQGLRVCYGKTMSAMYKLFGGGICGPEHCCSLDIELGGSETRGGGVNHHAEHYKSVCLSVCVCARTHRLTQALSKHPSNLPHFLATLLYLNCQHLA